VKGKLGAWRRWTKAAVKGKLEGLAPKDQSNGEEQVKLRLMDLKSI
jgi:hypothetical protein